MVILSLDDKIMLIDNTHFLFGLITILYGLHLFNSHELNIINKRFKLC